jgi:Tol biopolymer transport system component
MTKKIAVLAFALCLLGAVAGFVPSVAASHPAGGQGAKIAFSKLCEIAGCPPIVEHQQAEIWVMNGDGSDPRRLTDNTTWDLGAVWSPDGKTVAFYGVQYDRITDKPLGPPHVYLINGDGTHQRQLIDPSQDQSGRWPAFSPDGSKIAFDNGGQPSANIFVANTDGSDLHQLTFGRAERNIRPAWSPDGKQIAFTSQRDGNDEIYVMNADGSDQTRLTNNPADDNAPAWSPNGRQIAFQSDRDGNTEIYVMNADGSNQTRLTNYPGLDADPDWSPNGQQIAFHREVDIQNQILQVFVMNADGSNPTQLTGLPGDPSENGHPGWGHGPASPLNPRTTLPGGRKK